MDYIEDVAQILSEVEESLEIGQKQTLDGISLLKSIEVPTLNIGTVTFKKVKHERIVDYFHIIENGYVIGNFYFQGYPNHPRYVGHPKKGLWQVVMTVFGIRKESNFTARSRVLNSFLGLLAEFDLEAKKGSIIKK